MQILADVFAGTDVEGQDAVICDSMDSNSSRKFYSFACQSFPEVARFLTIQYIVQDLKDCVVEEELGQSRVHEHSVVVLADADATVHSQVGIGRRISYMTETSRMPTSISSMLH